MEFELGREKGIGLWRNVLNFLSESSDEYFFFWDFGSGTLYFSGDIQARYPILQGGKKFCTIADWCDMVYPRDLPALEQDLDQVMRGEKLIHNMEYRVIDRAGDVTWISCRGKTHVDEQGRPMWMMGRVSDSASTIKADRLTGAFTMEVLKRELEAVLEGELDGFLLLVGVDNLKAINLKNGREYGDQVLKRVVASLEDATDGTQRIYRVNGDCFAVVLPQRDADAVDALFSQVQRRLEGQCTLSGGCVPFREYLVPDGGTLYQYAENSLDYAKAQGKNLLWFFSAEDYEKDLAALELKEDLQKSVQDGFSGFSLCYQPQIALHGFRLHGAEALLRYRSPRRGDVSPGEFVPILEQSKLICPVGVWVLNTALEQCKQWRQKIPDMRVSINMSYIQFCQSDVTESVLKAVRDSGLPGSALIVEVTESMEMLDYPYLNEIFRQWKQVGIEISVDDFGTGYSSLGRLKQLEIDEIKIDRCFISNIQHSAYNYRLLSNMLELAESSQIRVCCEGVETTEELAVLEELRPNLVQGFLFSRPVPPGEFQRLYMEEDSEAFQQRLLRERAYPHSLDLEQVPMEQWPEEELVQAIMETENDIFYVSDLETYELYYLNPAGQRLFGLRDYKGKKCYKVLQGRDEPCPFCTNQCLKPDDFYIWDRKNEYCGRHFILKDKMMTYRGKRVRLEVALDVTKHEIISQNVKERLAFGEKVVEYSRILARNLDCAKAIENVLASVGEFYQADRAYLFAPDSLQSDHWKNTVEWCASNVVPQKENLQQVPPKAMERWVKRFERDQSVIILNLDTLRKTSPYEWQVLQSQHISRLIAVPIRINEQVIGFVGVDNPRYSIQDDSQIRVLSYFLTNRIRQNRNEQRYHALLNTPYCDILNNIGVGLWVIRFDPENGQWEMIADDTMYQVMGVTDTLDAQECYQFWYSRVNDGYYHYVNQSVSQMINSGRVVQLEYTWKHPQLGEVVVRCTGVRGRDEDGKICLRGYHRIISDIERPKFMTDVNEQDVFEYNELNKTIFFHTERTLLAGGERHESNFPLCWLEQEIVHPHFYDVFLSLFSRIRLKEDTQVPEILLKGKDGRYQWFRLSVRHLGREEQDLDTVVAVAEPTESRRVMELESTRVKGFYQALLSETVAYAEVDLESGQLKAQGGLWQDYAQDYRQGSQPHFIQVLEERLTQYLPAEELKELKSYRSREGWSRLLGQGENTRRLYYRRPIGEELRWVELVIHIFREDTTQNAFALIYLKDINAQKEREFAQVEAANRDPLTGKYNRAAFEREMSAYVHRFDKEAGPCGILMLLDVDNFKEINDQMGHLEGDRALKQVSKILTYTFRQEDLIGRMGGDEFLVFVKGHLERAQLEERLQQLLQRMQTDHTYSLTCSIGVTMVYNRGYYYNAVLQQADIALYESKKNGKNSFCFYQDLNHVPQ
ncbi:EAL domain-containing protein [Flavonifractor sp. An100]|uniref:EAL domain-containing protein n=1 Tax=Flavonifractor sp. An100 TaxID=1965538 RepID=UPI001302758C|nr:EAL domain-containing protein [Flavonifractor sp. An100]